MQDQKSTLPHHLPLHSDLVSEEAQPFPRVGSFAREGSQPQHMSPNTASGHQAPIIVLGNFQLTSRLGEGTYATAYHARQIGTDREAVVKIAHEHLVRGKMSTIIRERFETEIRASTRIKHPNIVTVYTAGDVNGAPAIAMEYVAGQMLEDFLEQNAPLTERQFTELFTQLASALATLHGAGIIHRDLSPRNIIVQEIEPGRFVPKLLDFGISQLDGNTRHTAGPIGTPQFMAPEILRGETSQAVDLFSFGLLMWWAVCGFPFIPEDATQFEAFKLLSSMEKAPEAPPEMKFLAPEIRRAVTRSLSPDPSWRPSANELSALFASYTGASSRDSAEFYAPPRDSVKPATSRRALEVLLLVHPSVPETLAREALVDDAVTLHRCGINEWERRFHSLERFDLVLIPLNRNDDDSMRFSVLELAAARTRVATPLKLYAYSDAMLPRETLRRMGLDEVWVLPRERAAMQLSIAEINSISTQQWQRVNSDTLYRSLEEDSHVTHGLIDELIGQMPEWILEIEDALVAGNRKRVFALCGEISSHAMSVGAENIIGLTRRFCELPVLEYRSSGLKLVEELESEYKLLFNELSRVKR